MIQAYEKVANKFLQTAMIKQSAKDYFFKAILCYLAMGDTVGARNLMGNSAIEDPSFESSR